MLDPDYPRMTVTARMGVLALCVGAGTVLGLLGTFAHQSLPPIGVALALATVALYIVGLRAWGGVRTPALAGSVGLGLAIALVTPATGGSVLIPGNTGGYTWLGGMGVVVFFALAWPHVQPSPQRGAGTIEASAASAGAAPRAFAEPKKRPLP